MEANTADSAPAQPAPAAPATPAGTNQTGTVQPAGGDAKPAEAQGIFGGGNSTMLIILGVIWLLFIMSWRSGKKREKAERAKREEELRGIVKGDKVVTIGRIHGVVVKADETTFTIKPDANKDYTMTFDREALLRVVNKKDGSGGESVADLNPINQNQN